MSAPSPLTNPGSSGEPSLAEIFATAKTVFRRLGPGGPLALIASTLPAIGAVALPFTFNIIGPWLQSRGALGLAIYTVGFMVCAGVAILPTHIQSALGGWAFGFWAGFPCAVAGVLGASAIGYIIALRATGDRALQLIAEKPKLKAVHDALLGSGFWKSLLIVLLIRGALSPFALTNLVLAATRVNPLVYALGTVIGLAPRTGAVVFLAVGLHAVTSQQPRNLPLWISGLAITLLAIIVIAQVANRAITKITATPEK